MLRGCGCWVAGCWVAGCSLVFAPVPTPAPPICPRLPLYTINVQYVFSFSYDADGVVHMAAGGSSKQHKFSTKDPVVARAAAKVRCGVAGMSRPGFRFGWGSDETASGSGDQAFCSAPQQRACPPPTPSTICFASPKKHPIPEAGPHAECGKVSGGPPDENAGRTDSDFGAGGCWWWGVLMGIP